MAPATDDQTQQATAAREAHLRGILEHIADGVVVIDTENRVRSMNRAALDIFGYAADAVAGLPFHHCLVDDDYHRFLLTLARCLDLPENRRDAMRQELTGRRRDGRTVAIDLSVRLMRAGGDDVFICLIQDISERKAAESALRESEERLKLAVTATRSGIWDADLRRGACWWSPEFIAMLGYTAEEMPALIGVWEGMIHPEDRAWVLALVARFIAGEAPEYHPTYRLKRRDGSWVWIESKGHCLRDANGQAYRFIGAMADVTERKRQEAQLLRMSTQDRLTDLPNRALLMDRLTHALGVARRRKRCMGVLFVDIDRFKLVNDSLGHEMGDTLLIQLGQRITRAIRGTDTVGRLGGDEFLILAEDLTEPQDAARVAKSVLDTVRQPFHIDGQSLFVSLSIGISVCDDSPDNGPTLLRFADTAMQAAKSGGGGAYRFFMPEMNAEALARLELERSLRQAIDLEQFVVYYQPKFAVDTLELTGMEALVRWIHPADGMIPPGVFISLAEETGLIVAIGAIVLREAMRQSVEWTQRGLPPLPVAVNLSVRQLQDEDACLPIFAILEQEAAEPRWLELEITESMMMDNIGQIVPALRRLRERGVSIAIDDFGTGHSSLSYLRRLPITTLKIDRSFINDVDSDDDSAAITATIISMARQLGLKVVAEGIETPAQLDFLRRHGCEHAQGFLLGRPMAAHEFERRFVDGERWNAAVLPPVGGL